MLYFRNPAFPAPSGLSLSRETPVTTSAPPLSSVATPISRATPTPTGDESEEEEEGSLVVDQEDEGGEGSAQN